MEWSVFLVVLKTTILVVVPILIFENSEIHSAIFWRKKEERRNLTLILMLKHLLKKRTRVYLRGVIKVKYLQIAYRAAQ